LGYIFEVVRDHQLAESYLVQLFCELSQQFNENEWQGTGNWCRLQRFAREKLIDFTREIKSAKIHSQTGLVWYNSDSKYLGQLTDEQRKVFYDIYYRGRTIAAISAELNKTEDLIRKTLKEAFTIMRKNGEN